MAKPIPAPDSISIKSETDEVTESDAIAAALTLVRYVIESGQPGLIFQLQVVGEDVHAGEIWNVEISAADTSGPRPHLNS